MIIYITSSDDHALDAYGVHAVRYLLKPIDENSLFEALNYALSYTKTKTEPLYLIKTKDGILQRPYSKIEYIENANRRLAVHLVNGETLISLFIRKCFEDEIQQVAEKRIFCRFANHFSSVQIGGKMTFLKNVSYMLSHVFFMVFIYLFLVHRYSKRKTIAICFVSCSVMNLLDCLKLNLYPESGLVYFFTTIMQIGVARYVRIHLSESPDGYLGIITDVTEDILQKIQLCYKNSHDPLTGLYKYDYFKEICVETLEKLYPGKAVAVAMLDLDHFKSINDTYGHNAGDRYLQGFSNTMKSMPKNHFLSARRSGDEFCMLIFDCAGRAEITDQLNSFYETLRQKAVALSDTQTEIISASCGFVLTTDAKSSITELLSRADEALYKVKRSAKGAVCRIYRLIYFVPNILSPASPNPGQMYACSFKHRSKCPI